ncbi:MAG: hypothetical protein ACPGXX_20090, partial [Planctomycetaceae bacterium]
TVAGIYSPAPSRVVHMTTPGWLNATTCQMLHPGFGEKGLPQQILIITPSVLPYPDVTSRAPPGNCQCDGRCSLLLHSDRVSVTSKLPEFYSWQVMSGCFAV